jgi:cytosine/adenosine deaminase-related metal-dependent hydrolase
MTYRKFKGDYLFTGEGMAKGEMVLVTNAEGTVQAVVPAAEAGEGVESYAGLLSPGFVNCHCHLELSHLKGVIPEGTGLVDFLLGVIRRRSDGRGADGPMGEATLQSIAEGEEEMLEAGIVAVGDICNTAVTIDQKRLGRLRYHNFIETIGFTDERAAERWAESMAVLKRFGGAATIVPHAPYSVSAVLFRLIAANSRGIVSIHNQESEAENEFLFSGEGEFLRLYRGLGIDVSFFRGTGKRSLESWLPHFDKSQPLMLVHDVATTEEDLRMAGGRDLIFCLCPNANLYIGGRLPDIGLLVRRGYRIVLGTDSLASNHRLNMLEEMKTLQRVFPEVETPTLLKWATLEGARALAVEEEVGSFEVGKRPGVLLLGGLEDGRLTEGTHVKRLL